MEISDISALLDAKLEPIKNDISAIKIDLHNLRQHVDSIGNRLSKLEDRQANMDVKLDSIKRDVSIMREINQHASAATA